VPDLIIGVFTCRPESAEWRKAFNALRSRLSQVLIHIETAGKKKYEEIEASRNYIAERALKLGARYLFFLDDDVVPPPDCLEKLLEALYGDSQARVAGAIYPRRRSNEPLVWDSQGEPMKLEVESGRIFRCGGVGGGCMMIDTRVFAKLKRPWFYSATPTRTKEPLWSDDVLFCAAVTREGYDVLAHGGVRCKHLDLGGK